MVTTIKENANYPMMSTSAWWALRKKFVQTMPSRVSADSLASLLSMTSKSARINLLSPLKKMGLVDNEGKTTERAKRWRDDNQYPFVCEEIRRDVYPEELLETFPNPDSPRVSIENWFAMKAGVGESAKGKMASLYLLLAEADPTKQDSTSATSKAPKTSRSVPSSKSNNSKPKKIDSDESNEKVNLFPNGAQKIPPPTHYVSSIAPSLHIDIQIHIPPDASPEQVDHIFASVAKHLYKGGSVNE